MVEGRPASTKSITASAPTSFTAKISLNRPAPEIFAPTTLKLACLSKFVTILADVVFPADIEVPTNKTTGVLKGIFLIGLTKSSIVIFLPFLLV